MPVIFLGLGFWWVFVSYLILHAGLLQIEWLDLGIVGGKCFVGSCLWGWNRNFWRSSRGNWSLHVSLYHSLKFDCDGLIALFLIDVICFWSVYRCIKQLIIQCHDRGLDFCDLYVPYSFNLSLFFLPFSCFGVGTGVRFWWDIWKAVNGYSNKALSCLDISLVFIWWCWNPTWFIH